MMRPYQGGDLINLYQEYPPCPPEMAKKGSFAIYPLFKYTKVPQQTSDFASSLIIRRSSFWSNKETSMA